MVKMNVTEVAKEGKVNGFHLGMLFWCCVIITFDSFDLIVFSSIIPSIMEEWGISAVEVGAIGSYGFFGMMIGAILFGMLADQFGRKNVLLFCVGLFSLFAFLLSFATGPVMFGIFRFISGIGIGGVLPNVLALLSDYSPKRKANFMVAIMMSCFSVGGIIAGIVGIYFIPNLGWHSVYWIAIIPAFFIPIMAKFFVDSPVTLLKKGQLKELCTVLLKSNPSLKISQDTEFTAEVNKVTSLPVVALFKNRLAVGTVMIWVAFFMCLLMINGINTWLPNLMYSAGYALGSSLSFVIVFNLGAIFGTLIFGGLIDKYGLKQVIVPAFILAAVCLTLLGFKNDMWVLYLLVFAAGACTMGAQNISYSFVSQYYPPSIRATGVGFASAVGRIGGIIGPTFGGILVSLNFSFQMNFIAFAIPGVFAGLAFLMIPFKNGHKEEKSKDLSNEVIEELA
jgi:AAHS family benzoate transporter-like MFS transporter